MFVLESGAVGLTRSLLIEGLIHEGDELREVNGIPMDDKDLEDIIPILVQQHSVFKFTRVCLPVL